MDNQTNNPNEGGDDSGQDRPLTSFLQAQQTVLTDGGSADDDSVDNNEENNEPPEERQEPQFGDILTDDSSADSVESFDDKLKSEFDNEVEDEGGNTSGASEMNSNKLGVALKALRQIEQQILTVIGLLEGGSAASAQEELKTIDTAALADGTDFAIMPSNDFGALKPIDGRVVEGVFDGRGMVGSDGKNYLVPPNYASKSKLVEGDMLKLTITPKGSFIYKQIGPIERSRLIGSLGFDQTIGEYYATSENRRWNVLKASVTYFKGEPSDEVVLLVPKNAPSKWAAVENIIKRNPLV